MTSLRISGPPHFASSPPPRSDNSAPCSGAGAPHRPPAAPILSANKLVQMEQSVHSVTKHTAGILTLHLFEWPTGTAVPSSCPSSTAARLTRSRKTLLDQPILRLCSRALRTATASGLQTQCNRGLWWLGILMKGAETVASQPEKHLIAQLVHVVFLPETQSFVKGRLELNPLGSVKGSVLDNATSSLVIVQPDFGFVNRGE